VIVHDLLTTNPQVDILVPVPETGPTAMTIVPLPLPPNAAARVLLHHLLDHGDIVGRDAAGQTIIQLSVNDYVLETLMTFDAEAAELEPEPDGEKNGPPLLVELVQPKMLEGRRTLGQARPTERWHAGQRSSSRCIARSCRAFPWTRQTSSA
jgi:hypothetical protein